MGRVGSREIKALREYCLGGGMLVETQAAVISTTHLPTYAPSVSRQQMRTPVT